MIGTRVEAVTELTEHAKEQVQVSIGGVSTSGSHEIMRYHCIIHQEALCATAIRFEDVMAAAIKDMNIINPGFVSDVGYLADIINHLNSLNTQLQGKSKNNLRYDCQCRCLHQEIDTSKTPTGTIRHDQFPFTKISGKIANQYRTTFRQPIALAPR